MRLRLENSGLQQEYNRGRPVTDRKNKSWWRFLKPLPRIQYIWHQSDHQNLSSFQPSLIADTYSNHIHINKRRFFCNCSSPRSLTLNTKLVIFYPSNTLPNLLGTWSRPLKFRPLLFTMCVLIQAELKCWCIYMSKTGHHAWINSVWQMINQSRCHPK